MALEAPPFYLQLPVVDSLFFFTPSSLGLFIFFYFHAHLLAKSTNRGLRRGHIQHSNPLRVATPIASSFVDMMPFVGGGIME